MTVIAWDGTTLAADKRGDYSGAALTVTKLHRVDRDRIAAVSGCGSHGMAVLQWLRDGADIAKYPPPCGDDRALVVVVHRDGTVLSYEGHGYCVSLTEATPLAMGAGRDFAMGALAMGADARQAVEITNRFSMYCGNGVDTMRFEEP